jgi:16S rRNA C1402 (ribose-2'-O) methylase RsmI
MVTILGDRQICVGRELTKAHEQLVVRPISGHLSSLGKPRGEYTLVVSPAGNRPGAIPSLPGDQDLAHEFGLMTESSPGSRRDAVRRLAERYNVPPREMYRLLEKARKA